MKPPQKAAAGRAGLMGKKTVFLWRRLSAAIPAQWLYRA